MHPIAQRIILFSAADREAPDLLAEKWNIWATAGMELCAVPGNHYTLLRPPNVAKVASFLTHFLDQKRLSPLRNEALSPETLSHEDFERRRANG